MAAPIVGDLDSLKFDNSLSSCKICLKDAGKYTCPRCNIRYCSAECYKSTAHAQCSESFYRDCFMQGLHDMKSSDDEKRKVMEMLQRVEDQDQSLDSGDEAEDLTERLEGLDLDKQPDKIWSRLTDDEKVEFEKMLSDGRLGNLISLWEPWWKTKHDRLVEEVGNSISDSPVVTQPEIGKPRAELSQLHRGAVSDNIQFDVLNLLYGYAYTARLHNGDHLDMPLSSSQSIAEISQSLHKDTFHSVTDALHHCFQCLQERAKDQFISMEFSVAVLEDIVQIVQGPSRRVPLNYVLASLSDLRGIFKTAKKSLSQDIKNESKDKLRQELQTQKEDLYRMVKKVEFYHSWVHKYGLRLHALLPSIELEFCTLSTDLASHKEGTTQLEEAWGGPRPPAKKKLIEEIER